jgi:hypothetical protein
MTLSKTASFVAALAMMLVALHSIAAAPKPKRISFKPGSSTTTVAGTLSTRSGEDYVLSARAGQHLRLGITPHGRLRRSLAYQVFSPSKEIIGGGHWDDLWEANLSSDGDYYIHLFQEDFVGAGRFTMTSEINWRRYK